MIPQSTLFKSFFAIPRFGVLSVFLFLQILATPLFATSVTTGTDQFGRNCDVVTWTDSTGNPRSVWIVNQTPGSFISKMTYVVGGNTVTATVPTTGFAFCTLVNHYYSTSTASNDNYGGNYTSNNGASNPASTQPGGSTYVQGAGVNRTIAFSGAHHLVWQANFQMYEHPWESSDEWYITVQYVFVDGRDDFIFSDSYDSGAIPALNTGGSNQQGSSALAPYDDFSYDGVGNTMTDAQSGIGFGTNYKFATNYTSGGSLSASTGWTYNVANTIPYAWMYKDATKTDREMGEVQNQPYSEKDAGYNAYWAMTAPPSTGVTMPSTLPYQMNEFASYVGMRFTWGTQYTCFQNNHTDGQSAYPAGGPTGSWGVYPVNAGSFNILVDQYTNQGVPKLITDTENIYKSTLTAATGTVVTTGPKGPGNYLSPQTGTMPTLTYSHPGFDFIMRRWRVACSGGTADVTLNAGGTGLYDPTLTFENLSSAPCTLTLNGVGQVEGTDYNGSYDPTNQIYYVTFLKTLAAGANQIVIRTICGSPTSTPTVTVTNTQTDTSTNSPTLTMTSTSTMTPTGTLPSDTPTPTSTFTPTFTYSPTITSTPSGLIKPGLKICFIGDSITYRGNYVKQVENYLNTIYPSYGLSYANVGVGGWTATQFLQYTGSEPTGLSYVINTVKPDIATICFGMNDAGYTNEGPSYFNQFTASMTSIISQLQTAGIKVVLLTPGMVDQTVPFAANTSNIPADYNTNTSYGLAAYTNWVMSYAAANNIPAFNVHTLSLSVNAAARAAHTGLPAYTDQPQDGIHPNPSGGLVYAYGLLSALGVPTQNRTITLNGNSISGSAGASTGAWIPNGNGGSFTLVTDPMPYIGNPQAAKILPFLNFQQTFNNIHFTATGLSAASYYIIVDGYQAGPVASSALSSGIDLLDYWLPPATSPTQNHTVQLVDASTLSAACYNTLIDDMENSNNFPQIGTLGGNSPWPENLWGGWWWAGVSSGAAGSNSPSPFVMTAPGYNSNYAANLTGTNNLGSPGTTAILQCACYTQYDNPQSGIQFMFKGSAGQSFRFQCHIELEDAKPQYNDYGYTFTATGNWQLVQVPYSTMTQPTWDTLFTFDPGQIEELEWIPYSNGNFSMSVDNVSFFCVNPTATSTATRTVTSTPTHTSIATSTMTPTVTVTSSNTSTSTVTMTPTVTATGTLPTSTSTPSSTPTSSPTGTPTSSMTNTSTSTLTSTPSATATSSQTKTGTATSTCTSTNTATVTNSQTVTSTYTSTPTSTGTSTPTSTQTVTLTMTSSSTASTTFTPTASKTATWSFTPTPSNTPILPSTIYPNPSDGTHPVHIHVQGIAGTANVRVEIFTIAFRKIRELSFQAVPEGTDVEVDLRDRSGFLLANGLYYVCVQANGRRQVMKLLLFR